MICCEGGEPHAHAAWNHSSSFCEALRLIQACLVSTSHAIAAAPYRPRLRSASSDDTFQDMHTSRSGGL